MGNQLKNGAWNRNASKPAGETFLRCKTWQPRAWCVQIEATPFFGGWLKVQRHGQMETPHIFLLIPLRRPELLPAFFGLRPSIRMLEKEEKNNKTMRLCPTKLWLQRFSLRICPRISTSRYREFTSHTLGYLSIQGTYHACLMCQRTRLQERRASSNAYLAVPSVLPKLWH